MKFFFDFFPVLAFYLAYNLGKKSMDEVDAMILATALLMLATTLQILWNWLKHKKVEKMHLIVLVVALVFGGATIYFRDPAFLIWKVTLVYWLFAFAFILSHFVGEKTIIKHMMGEAMQLPEHIWQRLSVVWIVFFALLGGVNLIVARNVSFDTWVDFKLFGLLGLTLVFALAQGIYLAKYIQPDTPSS